MKARFLSDKERDHILNNKIISEVMQSELLRLQNNFNIEINKKMMDLIFEKERINN